MVSPGRYSLLNLTAYLTMLGAAVSAVIQIDRILLRWQVILLVTLFAFLQSRYPQDWLQNPEPRETWFLKRSSANLLLVGQTLIVVYLLWSTQVSFSFLVLFFISSVSAASFNTQRATFVWIAIFTLIAALYEYFTAGWQGLARETVIFAGGYLFFGFVTNSLRIARQTQAENERLLVELHAKNVQLEEYARQVETLAALEERNRLAREVHDTLGHRLTSSAVQLEAAGRLLPTNPAKSASIIDAVRGQVREALKELRQTVGRLREPVEIELSLPQALRRLGESFSAATGLTVSLELPETLCTITPPQRLALYRTAQEGLTNIERHAQANQAWLRLVCLPDALRIEVDDNGQGLSDAQTDNSGYGLRGLQERAAALGGSVTLGPRPGGGTRLALSVPRTPGNILKLTHPKSDEHDPTADR